MPALAFTWKRYRANAAFRCSSDSSTPWRNMDGKNKCIVLSFQWLNPKISYHSLHVSQNLMCSTWLWLKLFTISPVFTLVRHVSASYDVNLFPVTGLLFQPQRAFTSNFPVGRKVFFWLVRHHMNAPWSTVSQSGKHGCSATRGLSIKTKRKK